MAKSMPIQMAASRAEGPGLGYEPDKEIMERYRVS